MREETFDCRTWYVICVRSPLPVEDQDREDIKGGFMEQSTEDIPLRKVVQDQLHQLIRDIDLGRCVCMCHKKLTSITAKWRRREDTAQDGGQSPALVGTQLNQYSS